MDLDLIAAAAAWPGTYWIILLIAASANNIRFRLEVDESLGWSQVPLPEKQWNYGAQEIRDFVRDAGGVGSPTLTKYVQKVLLRSDTCFAIALAGTTAYLWYWIATAPPPPFFEWAFPGLAWLAAPFGAMAIIYGLSDIAEGMKLAQILRDADRIDPAEAAAANILTRLKIASLCVSIIGAGLFVPIVAAQTIAGRVRKRQRVPETMGH
jgi:hypothetical protein